MLMSNVNVDWPCCYYRRLALGFDKHSFLFVQIGSAEENDSKEGGDADNDNANHSNTNHKANNTKSKKQSPSSSLSSSSRQQHRFMQCKITILSSSTSTRDVTGTVSSDGTEDRSE